MPKGFPHRKRQRQALGSHAPSLRDSEGFVGCALPALKRGANGHCAYGAGGERLLKGADFLFTDIQAAR